MSFGLLRDKDWRKWPEYTGVIAPLVAALKERGHKPHVGKGFWQKDFEIVLGKSPAVTVSVSHSGRRALRANRAAWLVLVGETRYRGPNRSRFPEPKAGLDFNRIAEAVEAHATSMRIRQQADREAKRAESKWRENVNKLPKSLRAYGIDVDATGASVMLRFTEIEHLAKVLRAAREAGVEP